MAFSVGKLRAKLKALPFGDRYLVAFSGGLDSSVLLHALVELTPVLGVGVEAVLVHHGLQPEADSWADHCQQYCRGLGAPITVLKVKVNVNGGGSLEESARQARYAALGSLVTSNVCLLTAHHLDDQAETLVLRLLRGSGPVGLAAMSEVTRFAHGWHIRPLLNFTREELTAYARANRLSWVDDPSNEDVRYDRNFIRLKVMPLLKRRWPSTSQTLARAAKHQAGVATLLRELADLDLAAVKGSRADTLSVKKLQSLPESRCANALRVWIQDHALPKPSTKHLRQVKKILSAKWDSTPCVAWSGAEIRRYRDDLYAMAPLKAHDSSWVIKWDLQNPILLPQLGITLKPSELEAQGLTLQAQSDVSIRFRRGGERCRPKGHVYHRPLKKLFQDAGVPPWERNRIPLVFVGDELAGVVGYWVCC